MNDRDIVNQSQDTTDQKRHACDEPSGQDTSGQDISGQDISGRYFLASHVFYCRIDQTYILFDLLTREYSFLHEEDRRVFQLLFEEQVQQRGARPYDRKTSQVRTTLNVLLARGVLVDERPKGDAGRVRDVKPVRDDRSSYPFDHLPPLGVGQFFRCFQAVLTTKLSLRLRPLIQITEKIRKRKRRWKRSKRPCISPDKIRDLVESFRILSVFFYSPREDELFDSLALVNFLALYGIFPKVIWGVRLEPFTSRVWVQSADISFNSPLYQVGKFTPIMVA